MLADVRGPTGPRAGLTRRALLGGSAVVGASLVMTAACTSSIEPPPESTAAPEPDPDARIREEVAGQEAALIAVYDATIAAHPGLADALRGIREEHAAHAEAMGPPVSGAAPPQVPATRAGAITALVEAEQQAIALRTSACEAAAGADLARVTALIAASEAGHAEFLRGVT